VLIEPTSTRGLTGTLGSLAGGFLALLGSRTAVAAGPVRAVASAAVAVLGSGVAWRATFAGRFGGFGATGERAAGATEAHKETGGEAAVATSAFAHVSRA